MTGVGSGSGSGSCSPFPARFRFGSFPVRSDFDFAPEMDVGEAAVRALIAIGADVNARDRSGATPLFLAAEIGRGATVERLLAAGAEPAARNNLGESPLYIAALKGRDVALRALLRHCRAEHLPWQDPEWYGDGWTPLHAAACANHPGIAKILLDAAAEIQAEASGASAGVRGARARAGDGIGVETEIDIGPREIDNFVADDDDTPDVSAEEGAVESNAADVSAGSAAAHRLGEKQVRRDGVTHRRPVGIGAAGGDAVSGGGAAQDARR